ncbi:unnamed protein product [Ectocarpus sp. CCAP 1310/34]|nr:unnamed protein product [Ectocarpus sp. CCAP 1310/34]
MRLLPVSAPRVPPSGPFHPIEMQPGKLEKPVYEVTAVPDNEGRVVQLTCQH